MLLTGLADMAIGIGTMGLDFAGYAALWIGVFYIGKPGIDVGTDILRHSERVKQWGGAEAYRYFGGLLGVKDDPAGERVAGVWAPAWQFLGPVVMGIGFGAMMEVPEADVFEAPFRDPDIDLPTTEFPG